MIHIVLSRLFKIIYYYTFQEINKQMLFNCDSCEKTFKSKQAAKWHNDSVHKGMKYFCNSCTASNNQFHTLRRHIISVHGVHPRTKLDDSHFTFQVAK